MPFTPEPTLQANPDVRIFFRGQLILEPQKEGGHETGKCEVYVNRSAPDHHLSIEVRQKRLNKPDEIVMRHLGPLAFAAEPVAGQAPQHGMFIRTKSAGVKAYKPASPEDESLEHAIDFDGPKLHNGAAGKVDDASGRPSILLEDGILYTAERTPPDLIIKLKRGETCEKLDPIAAIIGANIYLDEDEELLINWRQDGRDRTLSLGELAAGNSYEIYIDNDPLYEDEDESASHDEFAEYYKLLSQVPSYERFILKFSSATGRGSTVTPCMPTIKGGG